MKLTDRRLGEDANEYNSDALAFSGGDDGEDGDETASDS
jgi:hypothetical protein